MSKAIYNNAILDQLTANPPYTIDEQGFRYFVGEFPKQETLHHLQQMTFPSSRLIAYRKDISNILLTVAMVDKQSNQVLGLSILQELASGSLELISFIVSPQARNFYNGTRLLKFIAHFGLKNQKQGLAIIVNTSWNFFPIWKQMMEKEAWNFYRNQMILYRLSDTEIRHGYNWYNRVKLPHGFYIEHFQKHDLDELSTVYHQIAIWDPKVLRVNPTQQWESTLFDHSYLLKKANQIVGWLHCHETTRDTIQVTSLYVSPKTARGLAICLLTEGLQQKRPDSDVVFMVNSENQEMINLANKYLLSTVYPRHYIQEWGKVLGNYQHP